MECLKLALLATVITPLWAHECHLIEDCTDCVQTEHCLYRIRDGNIRCAYRDGDLDKIFQSPAENRTQIIAMDILHEHVCNALWTFVGAITAEAQDMNVLNVTLEPKEVEPEAETTAASFTEEADGMNTTPIPGDSLNTSQSPSPFVEWKTELSDPPSGGGFDFLTFFGGMLMGVSILAVGILCVKSRQEGKRKTYNQSSYSFDNFVNP